MNAQLLHLRKLLQEQPHNAALHLELAGLLAASPEQAAEAYLGAARAFLQQGTLQDAAAVCKLVLERCPQHPEPRFILATLAASADPAASQIARIIAGSCGVVLPAVPPPPPRAAPPPREDLIVLAAPRLAAPAPPPAPRLSSGVSIHLPPAPAPPQGEAAAIELDPDDLLEFEDETPVPAAPPVAERGAYVPSPTHLYPPGFDPRALPAAAPRHSAARAPSTAVLATDHLQHLRQQTRDEATVVAAAPIPQRWAAEEVTQLAPAPFETATATIPPALLASIPLLERLPPAIVQSIFLPDRTQRFAPDTSLLQPGREFLGAWLILQGEVRLQSTTGHKPPRLLQPGDLFGHDHYLTGHPPELIARTSAPDTTLLFLPPEALHLLGEHNPALWDTLWKTVGLI